MPGVPAGTRNALIPAALPTCPDVRANTTFAAATSMTLFQRLAPLMTQPPSTCSAVVSSQVASLPWLGSVRPKASSISPLASGSM